VSPRILGRVIAVGAFALALGAGCTFKSSAPVAVGDDDGDDDGDDSSQDDSGVGPGRDAGPPDAPPDICLTWIPAAPFTPCDIAPEDRGAELVLDQPGTYLYNTNSGELTLDGGAPIEHAFQDIAGDTIHLLSAASFEVGAAATLRVQGAKPLLIASWGAIDVKGIIDASSSTASDSIGAAANPTDCDDGSVGGEGGMEDNGGGGAGGGGFAGDGGGGGFGGMGNTNGGPPGLAEDATINLRGGCPGGSGGLKTAGGVAAEGGAGGGAIAMSALTLISVTGKIQAGGAGGGGGTEDQAGGGGGGSGGMVWLDAQEMVSVADAAVLAADGGGGGEGSGGPGTPGEAGVDGRSDGIVARGGTTGGNGGDGGQGSGDNEVNGEDADPANTGGGGGGGGAAGVIRVNGTLDQDPAAIVTPDPTT